MEDIEEILFKLVTAGLDERNDCVFSKDVDWQYVCRTAMMQGVAAICLDGLQRLHLNNVIPYPVKMQWIASAMKQEQMYNAQWLSATSLAKLWHDEGLSTYVMKGFVLANMYPRPSARYSCDMDCFLICEHVWGERKAMLLLKVRE